MRARYQTQGRDWSGEIELLADGLDDARDPHFAGCEAIEA